MRKEDEARRLRSAAGQQLGQGHQREGLVETSPLRGQGSLGLFRGLCNLCKVV